MLIAISGALHRTTADEGGETVFPLAANKARTPATSPLSRCTSQNLRGSATCNAALHAGSLPYVDLLSTPPRHKARTRLYQAHSAVCNHAHSVAHSSVWVFHALLPG